MADTKPTERHEEIQFRQLLEEAVTKPGTLMKAYSLFWNYSLGNQILALFQANRRGIALGPIASFNRWKELGRHVKRGEKAIELTPPTWPENEIIALPLITFQSRTVPSVPPEASTWPSFLNARTSMANTSTAHVAIVIRCSTIQLRTPAPRRPMSVLMTWSTDAKCDAGSLLKKWSVYWSVLQ